MLNEMSEEIDAGLRCQRLFRNGHHRDSLATIQGTSGGCRLVPGLGNVCVGEISGITTIEPLMIHIVFVIQFISPNSGGPAHSVPKLANALRQLGVSVEILTPEKGNEDTPAHRACPVTSIDTVFFGANSRLQEFFRSRKEQYPELVLHDNGVWQPINHLVARISAKLKLPFLNSPRGMLTPWAMSQKCFKKELGWHLYQKQDTA